MDNTWRMECMLGRQISSVCHHLEVDPIASSWILCKSHRRAVQNPEHCSVLLLTIQIEQLAVDTSESWREDHMSRIMKSMTQPLLLMTEVQDERYSIGSGWSFNGGLPEVDGKANMNFGGVERMRLMTLISDNGMAVVFYSCIVGPGLVAILRVTEVDERSVHSSYYLVNQNTETIIGETQALSCLQCTPCSTKGRTCDPSVCENKVSYDKERASRLELLSRMEYPTCNMDYYEKVMSGSWSTSLGSPSQVRHKSTCTRTGAGFQSALTVVMQGEIANVHPPRSSFRIVKNGKEEMNYFLGLEERSVSVLSKERSSTKDSVNQSPHIGTVCVRGERESKLICPECGKRFPRECEVRRHRTTVHEKRRDFLCPICGKAFGQRGHMNEHIRVRHSRSNVCQCRTCGKRFGNSSKLKRHVQTVHEKVRRFECQLCHGLYKEKSYLKRHMLSQHGVEYTET
uniref:C2H2-type domain-containing protein n=1 Tax=Rhodosorus marinus TaxID=101924 RepID=A0A7S2Z9K3_9RHOD|mmetsp:Transcript_11196/g.46775  ORF Transcript_11196/g.46775 Transcript_11196/m.46775 type:complete len:457 (+) Transcript_11196:158-1528(+)